MLGLRIGLNFGAGLKKTRVTRQLLGGLMAFDDRDLPVRLHGDLGLDTVEIENRASDAAVKCVAKQAEEFAKPEEGFANQEKDVPRATEGDSSAADADRRPLGTMTGRREGVSFTKGNRGDRTRIELFYMGSKKLDGCIQRLILAA